MSDNVNLAPPLTERIILLPSAARTGDTIVAGVINPGWKTLTFWAEVTANPGGGGDIDLEVNGQLPGGELVLVGSGPSTTMGGGTGSVAICCGPGVDDGWVGADSTSGRIVALPQLLQFAVETDGGSWTYEAGIDVSRV